MPNLATALKEEISRLARKEVRAQVASTQKASAQYRRDIAALKRQVKALEKEVGYLRSQEKKRAGRKPSPKLAEGARFSAARLKNHRTKLGLSAANYAKLVGVHQITIYNWEQGKTRPRPEQLAALVAVRGIGKREAANRLELLDE